MYLLCLSDIIVTYENLLKGKAMEAIEKLKSGSKFNEVAANYSEDKAKLGVIYLLFPILAFESGSRRLTLIFFLVFIIFK